MILNDNAISGNNIQLKIDLLSGRELRQVAVIDRRWFVLSDSVSLRPALQVGVVVRRAVLKRHSSVADCFEHSEYEVRYQKK